MKASEDDPLRRQNATIVALAREGMRATSQLAAALATLLEGDADTLGVDRVSIWMFTDDLTGLRCTDLYERAKSRHSSGAELRASDYPEYLAALLTERDVDAGDARADARTRELAPDYLDALGITSMLDVPVRVDGEMRGIVCHEHVGAMRTWTPDERAFAAAIADLVALRLAEAQRLGLQEDLAARESRLRLVFECAPLGAMLLDATGTIVLANPAMGTMLGVDYKTLPGQTFFDQLHDESVADARMLIARVVVERVACDAVDQRFRYRDTSAAASPREGEVWGRITASLAVTELDDQPLVIAMVENVTERRRALEALRHSEGQLRQLAENIHEVFWMSSRDRAETLYVSPLYEEVWGRSRAAVTEGQASLLDGVHPDDRASLESAIQRSADGRYDATYRIRRPDGSIRWVRDRAFPIHDDDGAIHRLAGLVEDVTERLEDERRSQRNAELLRHAQKMDALGRLAGGIAHDFGNLLAVIRSSAQLALRELPRDHPARVHVAAVDEAITAGSVMTQQLSDVSRRRSVQPKLLELNGIVARMVGMLGRACGPEVELVTALAPDLPLVFADEGEMEQVIFNIVGNACDAMRNGGSVTIRTAAVMSGNAASAGSGVATGLRLSISDTGVGMDDETVRHLFEPFFTTKPVGLGAGLGLSSAYAIVRGCGGHIRVHTVPGEGSQFDIVLPAATSAIGAHTEGVAGASTVAREAVVLLVEHDAHVRNVAGRLLAASGYVVLEAPNAEEALAAARDTERSIDVLVTELSLPTMGGRALSAALAVERAQLPVIYVSSVQDVEETVHASAVVHLQKPYAPHALLSAVRNALAAATRDQ